MGVPQRWSASLLIVILLALLAACGPEPEPTRPTPLAAASATVGPTRTPTRIPTATPAVTVLAEQEPPPSALVLWATATGPQLEALERLIAEVSQPAGIEVAVVGKSADGLYADIRANALAGLLQPDILLGTQDDLGLLQRDGILQPTVDGMDAGAFLPAAIEGATLDGQRWGTPLATLGSLLLLYNRRLVDAPPRTTDELIARARALTTGDQYGLVAGWAEPRWFAAWLTGFGGSATAPDGTPTLVTPEMLAALNLLKELRPSGPPPPSTYVEGVALFAQGRAAFAIDGDWALEGYRQYSETLDLAVAPLPIVPATGRVAAPPLGGIYLMYSKTLAGARIDQARAIGLALTQPAMQARIARDLGWLPALRAGLADPAVAASPALAAAAAQAEGAHGLPPIKGLRCAWDAIKAGLPSVLLGEQTQEEAVGRMQEQAMACMAT